MIKVDVRDALERDNVQSLEITPPSKTIECGELIEHCKMILCISDDRKYGIKSNGVYLHPTEKIEDGEELSFVLIPDEE